MLPVHHSLMSLWEWLPVILVWGCAVQTGSLLLIVNPVSDVISVKLFFLSQSSALSQTRKPLNHHMLLDFPFNIYIFEDLHLCISVQETLWTKSTWAHGHDETIVFLLIGISLSVTMSNITSQMHSTCYKEQRRDTGGMYSICMPYVCVCSNACKRVTSSDEITRNECAVISHPPQ